MSKKVILILVLFAGVVFYGMAYAGLNDGLVAYYPFNGNANDESGHGLNGAVYGASLTADGFGKSNSAYEFNGVNNYGSMAQTKALLQVV